MKKHRVWIEGLRRFLGFDKMTDEYTSILDKTDWRKTIQKALEDAVLSIGKGEEFFNNVEQAIEAVKATYPNWDATKEIDEMVLQVTQRHNKAAESWILQHPSQWPFPWIQMMMLMEWKSAMYREILQRLKNIVGAHRMLLWGISDSSGVGYDQLADSGDSKSP